MPLPEDEQRQLQEIERALYEDDPKFARRIRAGDPRVRSKRTLLRVLLGVVIGAGVLPAGAVTHRAYLEAAGLAIVLLSLVAAVVSRRRDLGGAGPRVRGRGPGRRRARNAGPGRAGGPGLWSGWKSAGAAARRATAGGRGGPGADTGGLVHGLSVLIRDQ
jgi:hypothetical protein